MKLILTSTSLANSEIRQGFLKILPATPRELNLLAITTASHGNGGDKRWMLHGLTQFSRLGFKAIDLLEPAAIANWRERIAAADVIYLPGGNSFWLAAEFKRLGVDRYLWSQINQKVVFGSSAGALIFSNLINSKITKNLTGPCPKNFKPAPTAIGKLKFFLYPHLTSEFFPARTLAWAHEFARLNPVPLVFLNDQSAIMIDETNWVMINPLNSQMYNFPAIRKRASVCCIRNNKILMLKVKDPTTQSDLYILPGGGIEKGETASHAALREVLEETGYQVQLGQTMQTAEYNYFWDGQLVQCRTNFFIGGVKAEPEKIKNKFDASFIKKICWVDLEKLPQILASQPQVLTVLQKLLNN